MNWEYVVAVCVLTIGAIAALPTLRRVCLRCQTNHVETTATVFVLLLVYAVLSAPILMALIVGVTP
jgi:hypothetical protein